MLRVEQLGDMFCPGLGDMFCPGLRQILHPGPQLSHLQNEGPVVGWGGT